MASVFTTTCIELHIIWTETNVTFGIYKQIK